MDRVKANCRSLSKVIINVYSLLTINCEQLNDIIQFLFIIEYSGIDSAIVLNLWLSITTWPKKERCTIKADVATPVQFSHRKEMHPTKLLSLFTFFAGSSLVFAKNGEAPVAATESKLVVQGSASNFKELIGSAQPVLVEFFAPWCGHCKKLAPEYETAAGSLQEQKIQLASVDCTVEKDICEKMGIKGYPTLAVFREGKEITKYQGPREAAAIVKFMKKQAAPAVTALKNSDDLKKFRESDEVVVVGFFKDPKSESAKTFGILAENMRAEHAFAAMDEIPAPYKDGQVYLFKKFDEGEVAFDEKLSVESLAKFVARESIPLTAEIGPENYSKYVDSGIPMAYFFYADEKQRDQYTATLQTAAKAVKGKVNVVLINGALYGQHAEVLNLSQEWPAFGIHDMAKDFKFPLPKTEKITVESLTKHLKAFVDGSIKPHFKSEPIPKEDPSQPIVTLVHDNFDAIAFDKNKDVLVEIYAPWCGACKRIAPEYEELAKNVAAKASDKFVIAKFDGTANDIPASLNFKLEHFPTFVLVRSKTNEAVNYNGDLSYNNLAGFLQEMAGNKIVLEMKSVEEAPATPDHEQEESEDSDHMEL